jgi:hypothetical protein
MPIFRSRCVGILAPRGGHQAGRSRQLHVVSNFNVTFSRHVRERATRAEGVPNFRGEVWARGKANYTGTATTEAGAALLSDDYIRANALELPLNFASADEAAVAIETEEAAAAAAAAAAATEVRAACRQRALSCACAAAPQHPLLRAARGSQSDCAHAVLCALL